MPATIKDLAKHLSLSVSTVSYALNNGPKPVSQAVRDRVKIAARDLDYRPNRLARNLVTGRTRAIGVIPGAVHRDMMLGPFIQVALNGIVNASEDLQHDLVLLTAFDRSQNPDSLEGLLDGRVDGFVIIAPRQDWTLPELLRMEGFPYAVVAAGEEGSSLSFDCDNADGVRQMILHLHGLGHRRIAHITGPDRSGESRTRTVAFIETMGELDLPIPDAYIQPGNYHRDVGAAGAEVLLDLSSPPTAVFAANDEMAFGVCDVARARGLRVPEDLSVAGFDDIPLSRTFLPPLTTVRQPIEEMGAAALAAVVALVEGRESESRKYPTTLCIRGSTHRPTEDKS